MLLHFNATHYIAHDFLEMLKMRFKKIAHRAVLSLLISPACFADEPLAEYRRALDYCAGMYMARMDDRVSPANVIADALVTLCRQKAYAKFEVIAAAQSKAFWDGYHRAAIKTFTAYVLQHRTGSIK